MSKSKTGKAQITTEDFDNAVKQPWGNQTCIVAQFMKRNGMPTPVTFLEGVSSSLFATQHDLWDNVVSVFDRFRVPGDEKEPALQALRAILPIEIEL